MEQNRFGIAAAVVATCSTAFAGFSVFAELGRLLPFERLLVIGTAGLIAFAAIASWYFHEAATSRRAFVMVTALLAVVIATAGAAMAADRLHNIRLRQTVARSGGTVEIRAARTAADVRLSVVPRGDTRVTWSGVASEGDPQMTLVNSLEARLWSFRHPQSVRFQYHISGGDAQPAVVRRSEPVDVTFAADSEIQSRARWMMIAGGTAWAVASLSCLAWLRYSRRLPKRRAGFATPEQSSMP